MSMNTKIIEQADSVAQEITKLKLELEDARRKLDGSSLDSLEEQYASRACVVLVAQIKIHTANYAFLKGLGIKVRVGKHLVIDDINSDGRGL